MKEYPIWYRDKKIGTACVSECGLYMEIACSCLYADNNFFRIEMLFSDRTVALGSWIREGTIYSLQRKIPAKLFGDGDPVFRAVDKTVSVEEHKYPVISGKPFDQIDKLRKGKLRAEHDATYLII